MKRIIHILAVVLSYIDLSEKNLRPGLRQRFWSIAWTMA